MNKDIFDGFAVKVFFDENGDYLAHFVKMPNVSAFANTPEDALSELAVAWQGVKESYRKHNEPIPQASPLGSYEESLNICVDAQLYHALVGEAAKTGMSLGALVAQKLAKLTATDTLYQSPTAQHKNRALSTTTYPKPNWKRSKCLIILRTTHRSL